jgi:hypothetical protein
MLIFTFCKDPQAFSMLDSVDQMYVKVSERLWTSLVSLFNNGYLPESLKSLADISYYGSTHVDAEKVLLINKGLQLVDSELLPFGLDSFFQDLTKLIEHNDNQELDMWAIGD